MAGRGAAERAAMGRSQSVTLHARRRVQSDCQPPAPSAARGCRQIGALEYTLTAACNIALPLARETLKRNPTGYGTRLRLTIYRPSRGSTLSTPPDRSCVARDASVACRGCCRYPGHAKGILLLYGPVPCRVVPVSPSDSCPCSAPPPPARCDSG